MNLDEKIELDEIEELKDIHSLMDCLKSYFLEKRKLFVGNESKILGNFPHGFWFRGHSNEKWKLQPTIFRESNGRIYDETNILIHFKLMNANYDDLNYNNFDWLTLMQHYNVPTRLLDWTESILVALYFIVSNIQDDSNDGCLYVLDARGLNQEVLQNSSLKRNTSNDVLIRSWFAENRKISTLNENIQNDASISIKPKNDFNSSIYQKPIAVFPKRLNNRIIAQSGVFTMHGGKILPYKGDDMIPPPISIESLNSKCKEKFLKKILIRKGNKNSIRESLFAIGIHEATIFPELSSQGNYYRELYAINKI